MEFNGKTTEIEECFEKILKRRNGRVGKENNELKDEEMEFATRSKIIQQLKYAKTQTHIRRYRDTTIETQAQRHSDADTEK